MQIKMQPSVSGLCVRCRHGHVTEATDGHVEVWCNYLMDARPIRRPITRCTDFGARGHDDEHEMRKIAWTLNTNKRGELGFRPPKKRDDE